MNEPPGRVRRDPRTERQARAHGAAVAAAGVGPVAHAAPLRVVDDPAYLVLAVPDLLDGRLSEHDGDVLGAARLLANGDGAVVAFGASAAADLGLAGADRVIPGTGGGPERRAASVLAAIRHLEPRYVVFPDTIPGGGDIGRRVAARLGERPASAIVAFEPGRVIRRVQGGALELGIAPPRILLVRPEAAQPVTDARHEARPLALPDEAVAVGVEDDGWLPVDANTVPLAEADIIVAAGNGVTDWPAFHAVAAALGAAEGGSRAVCDAGHVPRERQVGASGTLVNPRLYLAFGIAGATQHLEGIRRCERVVAVNTDLHADMVQRADLAVIADAQAVMPALERLARMRRG
ncbi:MAG: electron transfer flavoprotein subunit alpha/FixB family protein [Alphaproteobacteria bacterium]